MPTIAYAARLVGGVSWSPRRLLRVAGATALMGLAAAVAAETLGGSSGVAAGALAAIAAYVLVAPGLRVLDREDTAWLEQAVGRRLPGPGRRWIAALNRRAG